MLRTTALPRLLADEATPERLTSLLAKQGGKVALMSAEGDAFDIMVGRYSTNGSANLGVYLKGHAGDTIRVDRVNRPPEHTVAPALTIGTTVQPAVIAGLMRRESLHGKGLLPRFLYAMPETTVGYREIDPPAMPESVRQQYAECVRRLLEYEPLRDEEGNAIPFELTLDEEARDWLLGFQLWTEHELRDGASLADIREWGSKLVGAVVRIAGVLHMAEHVDFWDPWEIPISLHTMRNSIRIGGSYLRQHALAAFGEMGADSDVENARYLLWRIEEWGVERFTKRQLFEKTKGRFKKVRQLDPPLELLVEHGYLRALPAETTSGPGRPPSPTYLVNPLAPAQNSRYPQYLDRTGKSLAQLTAEASNVIECQVSGAEYGAVGVWETPDQPNEPIPLHADSQAPSLASRFG